METILCTIPVSVTVRSVVKLTGKNTDFVAYFDCNRQSYTVYYKGKFLIGDKYRYADIKSYLD